MRDGRIENTFKGEMSKNDSLKRNTEVPQQSKLHISPLNIKPCQSNNCYIQTNGCIGNPLANSYLQSNNYTADVQLNGFGDNHQNTECVSNLLNAQNTSNSDCMLGISNVIYAPVVTQQQQGNTLPQVLYEQKLLKQIIAEDVHDPKNKRLTEKDLDSRDTVVKRTSDGAVQITYRKMINTVPVQNKNPVYILPKLTSTNEHASINVSQNEHCETKHPNINTEKKFNMNNSTTISPNHVLNISSNNVHNNLSNSVYMTSSNANSPFTSDCNSPFTSRNNLSSISKLNMQTWLPCTDIKSTELSNSMKGVGSSSLTISLPKIRNRPVIPNNDLTLTTCDLSTSCLKSPVVDFSSYTNDNLSTYTSHCDTALLTEKLFASNELIDNLDLDLSSMNTDTITMTTFLQNDLSLLTTPNSLLNLETCTDVSECLNQKPIPSVQNASAVTKHMDCESLLIQSNNDNYQVSDSFVHHEIQTTYDNPIYNEIIQNHSFTSSVSTEKELIDIIDVSPEMSTTSGGNKIILIGSWNAKNARYYCKFGDHVVDAEFIQNGVLRCYSPALKAGKVKLCVLHNDDVISKEVEFEFVNPTEIVDETRIKHEDWMSMCNQNLIKLLKERITTVAEMMGVEGVLSFDINECDFEEILINVCKQLMTIEVEFQYEYNIENTMTVLHLAAGLGYIKLTQLLLNWVESNPNKIIMVEACPVRYDQFKLLPIMWSSAKGHFNTTCVLHQWNESTIEECDSCGCSVIDLAKECRHGALVQYLERLLKKSTISRYSSVCITITVYNISLKNRSVLKGELHLMATQLSFFMYVVQDFY